MCGKIMTVLFIFVVLNCSMARYNGRLHCIVGVLPTCYKRKAATYFYPPGGTGPNCIGQRRFIRYYVHRKMGLLDTNNGPVERLLQDSVLPECTF